MFNIAAQQNAITRTVQIKITSDTMKSDANGLLLDYYTNFSYTGNCYKEFPNGDYSLIVLLRSGRNDGSDGKIDQIILNIKGGTLYHCDENSDMYIEENGQINSATGNRTIAIEKYSKKGGGFYYRVLNYCVNNGQELVVYKFVYEQEKKAIPKKTKKKDDKPAPYSGTALTPIQ